VLVATTPLWIALLELFSPHGERLTGRGWAGLAVGLAGVVILLSPRLHDPTEFFQDAGPLLVLGSAASWALGSILIRLRRTPGSHLAAAACQMLVGGLAMTLLGVVLGEPWQLTAELFTPSAIFAFFYL